MTKPNEPINPFGYKERMTEKSNVLVDRQHSGLTKREYFAALAMQGIIARVTAPFTEQGAFMDAAIRAVRCADALIEELNKP